MPTSTYTQLLEQCFRLTNKDLQGVHISPIYDLAETAHALFPFPKKYKWKTLELIATFINIQKPIVCITPINWQLDPLVFDITQACGVPIIYIPYNNPSLIQVMHDASPVDLILTTPDLSVVIATLLSDIVQPPPSLLTIQICSSTPKFVVPKSTFFKNIYHEIHLVPGLPLLYTDPKSNVFEMSSDFEWRYSKNTVCSSVSLKNSTSLPINELQLPFLISNNNNQVYF